MNFDKVYIQMESDGAAVKETVAAFDIYCSKMPFTLVNKAKELTTREWHDEDGLDVYVPEEGLKLSDYELEATFCCKGDKNSSNAKINAFVKYLLGGYMKIYCTWTKIGRQHVRFAELKDDATLVRDNDGDILVFNVKFNVDDPMTDIEPSGADFKNLIVAS